jgi:hypothetical protein
MCFRCAGHFPDLSLIVDVLDVLHKASDISNYCYVTGWTL